MASWPVPTSTLSTTGGGQLIQAHSRNQMPERFGSWAARREDGLAPAISEKCRRIARKELHLRVSAACMGPSRIVATAPTGPLKGAKARLILFGGLIAIALVQAWPNRSEEQALIEVGHRLCEASINGTPINPRRPRLEEKWTSRLTGLIENLPSRLRERCLNFSERCDVRVMQGRLSASDDADHLLKLSDGDGGWVMLIVKAHSFYPTHAFEVKAVGAGWWFGRGRC